jgi:hypothetical protein
MSTTAISSTGYRPAYEPPELPPISLRAELALLLRVLAGRGYDDLRAGCVGRRSGPPTSSPSTVMA